MSLTQGFNISEANALKEEVASHLEALASKTDILAEIEREIHNTWKGPDADNYLDSLFTTYNDVLMPQVKYNFTRIDTTIDEMIEQWTAFQNQ